MKIDERRRYILDAVNQNKNVRISALSKKMAVSRETIRKDIYNLAEKGLVSAIRGGAEAVDDDPTSRFDQRKAVNQDAKREMAQRALSYIKDGATIFLDSGTSSYELAEALKQEPRHDLSIITSSTFVAQTLLVMKGIQIVLLGVKDRYQGQLPCKQLSRFMLTLASLAVEGSMRSQVLRTATWKNPKRPKQ